MGYYASTSGQLRLSLDQITDLWSTFDATIAKDHLDPEHAARLESRGGIPAKVAAVIANCLGAENGDDGFHLGTGDDGFHIDSTSDGYLKITLWGYGKLRANNSFMDALAGHGAVGHITVLGEDDKRWRWRLAGGQVHTDHSRILYEGDVDTEG